jgi:hypothetical protein
MIAVPTPTTATTTAAIPQRSASSPLELFLEDLLAILLLQLK